MDVYTVEVGYTDRTREDGAFVSYPCIVTVGADDDVEATLVACQLVGAIRDELDGQVTYARILNVVC